MFRINAAEKTLTMSRGDTGELIIGVTGYTFNSNDRALFTVRLIGGSVVMRRELQIVNNTVTITFVNSDTDSLEGGNYEWDIRYVTNPIYENGEIVDGTDVVTPEEPMRLILLTTVGQI